MRQTCLRMISTLAIRDERIFFIGSDLGAGALDEFKREMPDRFLMEGVSEAHIIGMAAGLALEGKIVYVNTIASFLTRRCYEQIVLDLCLHRARVRLVGSGGGLVYAPLGQSHLATEDLAILRALPGMTIFAPADAGEMERLMPLTVDLPGPVYIRLGKGGDPLLTDPSSPFEIGRQYLVREGKDALILSTGVMLRTALEAARNLAAEGVSAAVLHAPTLKPFDRDQFYAIAGRFLAIVAVEEHSVIGGLGSLAAEIICEAGFSHPVRFRRIGLPDVFPDEYGSQASLMQRYELTAGRICAVVRELLRKSE